MNESVVPRFRYRGFARARVMVLELGGALCLLFTFGLVGFLVFAGLNTASSASAIVCWAGWALLIGSMTSLTLMNQYPTVWLTDDYLEISFLIVARVRVAWKDVIDVRTVRWPPFGDVLVQAHRITPVHRLYGWLYSRTLRPSFLVGRDIEKREWLLIEIQRRVANAQQRG